MLALYSKQDQNRIQIKALREALYRHRNKYIYKRFGAEAWGGPLNYKWKKAKQKSGETPVVSSGTFARLAFTGKGKASMSKGKVQGQITLPAGHPLPKGRAPAWPQKRDGTYQKASPYRNEIQRIMTSITKQEIDDLASFFSRRMVGIIDQGITKPRKPRAKKSGSRKTVTARRRTFSTQQRQKLFG
jgi:hypothetical protein